MFKYIKKFWDWGWSIYHKNEELWNYLIVGGIGVIISIASYWGCRQFGINVVVSNVISWIITVLAMYILNKIFVFKTKCESSKALAKEFAYFIIARLLTLFIETAILYIGTDIIHFNDIIVKVFAQIVIIILNYIFSKLIIFRKKKQKI